MSSSHTSGLSNKYQLKTRQKQFARKKLGKQRPTPHNMLRPAVLSQSFKTYLRRYPKTGRQATVANRNESLTDERVTDGVANGSDEQKSVMSNPMLTAIADAYYKTLGKGHIVISEDDLIVLEFGANETIRNKYNDCHKEVLDFCEELNIASQIPEEEYEDNNRNWLDVLVLRSCWWFSQSGWRDGRDGRDDTEKNEKDVIRVNGRYGLQRGHNPKLEPLFSMAYALEEMSVNVYEVSLLTTFALLNGMRSLADNNTASARMRKKVHQLLGQYEQEFYGGHTLRLSQIMTNQSKLHRIVSNF